MNTTKEGSEWNETQRSRVNVTCINFQTNIHKSFTTKREPTTGQTFQALQQLFWGCCYVYVRNEQILGYFASLYHAKSAFMCISRELNAI